MARKGRGSQSGGDLIIVRRDEGGGHAHHGGAWKVAYADFVTAMTVQPNVTTSFTVRGRFDDANLRRSAQAAVAACARVERALEILGDDIPEHLMYAGRLRLDHREASLDELGHFADPPMTKDAVAGRIRRLLALADKTAKDLGIPSTDANLPDDLDVG